MLQPVAKMLRHSRKHNLSCFKSLLVTGLWDKILTSLLPPIQSCSSKFWAWSCIASNFDKGCRGGHKYKTMDRLFKPKYGTVSQVLLQLVAAPSKNYHISHQQCIIPTLQLERHNCIHKKPTCTCHKKCKNSNNLHLELVT